MFEFSFDTSTKKTIGEVAVGSGVALLVYNKFERPREPMGLPLALIGGGLVVLALTKDPTHSFFASGPQEEVDKKSWQDELTIAKVAPWIGLGAVVGTGLLVYMRMYG